MIYFIKSLADVEQCTIRAAYRSAICSNGYAELDPEKDADLIAAYQAIEAPPAERTTKKVKKEAGE